MMFGVSQWPRQNKGPVEPLPAASCVYKTVERTEEMAQRTPAGGKGSRSENELATLVRQLIDATRLPLGDLGKKIGYSSKSPSAWQCGERRIPKPVMDQLLIQADASPEQVKQAQRLLGQGGDDLRLRVPTRNSRWLVIAVIGLVGALVVLIGTVGFLLWPQISANLNIDCQRYVVNRETVELRKEGKTPIGQQLIRGQHVIIQRQNSDLEMSEVTADDQRTGWVFTKYIRRDC